MFDNSLGNSGIGMTYQYVWSSPEPGNGTFLKDLQESFASLKYLKISQDNDTEDDQMVK